MGISTTDSATALESTRQIPETASLNIPSEGLPGDPLVVIEPTRRWLPVSFADLWRYRELLYFMTLRDIKIRYKQTVMGIAWVVMQPLLMTLIFSVFLGILARVPTGGLPYSLLIFSALLPWNFFSSSVSTAAYSLVGNSNLVTKVYFPRILVPAASVAGRLVDFTIAFVIMSGLIAYYRLVEHSPVGPTLNLVAIPFLIALVILLSLAVGMLISALNVKYRDIGVALPVVLQLFMFVSPVLYSSAFLLPVRWQRIYALNPLVGIIEAFRVALLGGNFNRYALAISIGETAVMLVIAAYVFRRFERDFADFV